MLGVFRCRISPELTCAYSAEQLIRRLYHSSLTTEPLEFSSLARQSAGELPQCRDDQRC
jgi:hypothetical protein